MGEPVHKTKTGRPKGIPNKVSTVLKEAILMAAEDAGNNLNGKGLAGYLEFQARENPNQFMQLLGKVLPMQRTEAAAKPAQTVIQFVAKGTDEVVDITPKPEVIEHESE